MGSSGVIKEQILVEFPVGLLEGTSRSCSCRHPTNLNQDHRASFQSAQRCKLMIKQSGMWYGMTVFVCTQLFIHTTCYGKWYAIQFSMVLSHYWNNY